MSWDRRFDNPVPLPRGGPARTFRDAADYIRKLPKEEHDRPEWRLAVQMLIDAAENRGPMLFARMGILRAMEAKGEYAVRLQKNSAGLTAHRILAPSLHRNNAGGFRSSCSQCH
jgi:hypothetical protein